MLAEMKKLVVEAEANSAEFTAAQKLELSDLRGCSQVLRYKPTNGQILRLKELATLEKAPVLTKRAKKKSKD